MFLSRGSRAPDSLTAPTDTPQRYPYLSALTHRAIEAEDEQAFFYAAELYKKAIDELNASPKEHAREIAECWHQMAHCQYEFDKKEGENSMDMARKLYQKLDDPIQYSLQPGGLYWHQDVGSVADYHWRRE